MTSCLSRPLRLLTLLFAAIQFAVPAVVSVVDGAQARGGRNSGSHVEEVGGKQCRPPHSEDCLLCRFLSATTGVTTAAPAPTIEEKSATVPEASVTLCAVAERYGFNPRAPPIS
jgi:hypothetical protein